MQAQPHSGASLAALLILFKYLFRIFKLISCYAETRKSPHWTTPYRHV